MQTFILGRLAHLRLFNLFKNPFGFTTAGYLDCVAAVERHPIPCPSLKCRFYFLVIWDHGFHCGALKTNKGSLMRPKRPNFPG